MCVEHHVQHQPHGGAQCLGDEESAAVAFGQNHKRHTPRQRPEHSAHQAPRHHAQHGHKLARVEQLHHWLAQGHEQRHHRRHHHHAQHQLLAHHGAQAQAAAGHARQPRVVFHAQCRKHQAGIFVHQRVACLIKAYLAGAARVVEPRAEGIGGGYRHKAASRHVGAQLHEAKSHACRLACGHAGRRPSAVTQHPRGGRAAGCIGYDRGQNAALAQPVEQRHADEQAAQCAPQCDAGQAAQARRALQHGILAVGERHQQHGRRKGHKAPQMALVAKRQAAQRRRKGCGDKGSAQAQPHRPPPHHGNNARHMAAVAAVEGLRHVAHAARAHAKIGGGVQHLQGLIKQSEQSHAHGAYPQRHQLGAHYRAQYARHLHAAKQPHCLNGHLRYAAFCHMMCVLRYRSSVKVL